VQPCHGQRLVAGRGLGDDLDVAFHPEQRDQRLPHS